MKLTSFSSDCKIRPQINDIVKTKWEMEELKNTSQNRRILHLDDMWNETRGNLRRKRKVLSQVEKLREGKNQSEDREKLGRKKTESFSLFLNPFYLAEGLLFSIGVKVCSESWEIHSTSLQAQLGTSLILPHILYSHGLFLAEFMPFRPYN